DSILIKHIGELEQIMANLIQDNKHLEERLDSHGSRLYKLKNLDIPQQETNSYQANEDYKNLYEALEKSMTRDQTDQFLTDLAEAQRKKKKGHDSPKTPPGSPPHQPPPPPPLAGQSYDSTTPSSSKTAASAEYTAWTTFNTRFKSSISSIPKDLHMDDDSAPDEQVHSSDDEYIRNDHIPKTSALASTYAPQLENSLLAQIGDMATFIDWYNVSKPLPMGGQPGQVTIQTDFFFNKDLEYLRYGSKGGRPALSISKMKAAYYPDVGLEQMVPDQMWTEEECKYDIAAIIEVLSLYGYDYMKKIVLRRADLKEYITTEKDFKYLYQSDFKDLYLLNLQVIKSPRAVSFRDKYGVQMIMRFNEIHKFSDGTLHQIAKALDYRVKEFKVNRMNPGLNIRGSEWCMMAIVEIPKTNHFVYCTGVIRMVRLGISSDDPARTGGFFPETIL
nr:hypothetical protein [Tanacetum cinerariifolium]GEX81043.1 hypothetical protein [Tanacetum cinerariifolium]